MRPRPKKRILLRGAEDAHCAFVGVAHGVIHEHVGSWMINAKFQHCCIARPYLEALDVMESLRRIAAAIDGTEDRPDYMKIGEQVGANINEENPHQLTNFD